MEILGNATGTKFQHNRRRSSIIEQSRISKTTPSQTGKSDRDFKTTTELIAEKIVKKQLEYGGRRKKTVNFLENPQLAVRLNNVVVQRILRIQTKETKKENPLRLLHHKSQSSQTDSSTPTKTGSFSSASSKYSEIPELNDLLMKQCSTPTSKISVASNVSSKRIKSQKKKTFERPRFSLSTKDGARRLVENKRVQAVLQPAYLSNFGVQTDFSEFLTISTVQVEYQPSIATKKLQTRLYKKSDNETDPIHFCAPSKSTNTHTYRYKPHVDRYTQFFEYMTESDVFCLDWINKYVFPVNVNPFSVIVDRKLRDVSEVCTKSTLFSDVKTLRNLEKSTKKRKRFYK